MKIREGGREGGRGGGGHFEQMDHAQLIQGPVVRKLVSANLGLNF